MHSKGPLILSFSPKGEGTRLRITRPGAAYLSLGGEVGRRPGEGALVVPTPGRPE
jgi:hypothetical protein